MRYVILRDDDTCGLTPVEWLDRLYRPFLDRSLPVNLAVIPNVRTDLCYGEGIEEGFLVAKNGSTERYCAIDRNSELVRYLGREPGLAVVQHGYTHEFINGLCEFELRVRAEVARRLKAGRACFVKAGLPAPDVFVAPYDRFTRASLNEAASQFRVISTGWFEWKSVPVSWWPRYLAKKMFHAPHWRVGNTILLSHPGCHISYQRDYRTILNTVRASIQKRDLTVLVTHWWEFFRDKKPDVTLIEILHRIADFLSETRDVKVVRFQDVAEGAVPIT